MARDFERMLGNLTEDETAELAETALGYLPDEMAVEAIKSWAKSHNMVEELAAIFDELDDEGAQ